MKFKIEDYDRLLRIDIPKLETGIHDYIIQMRNDEICLLQQYQLGYPHLYIFFEMNDITLHWKKLKKFKGRFRNIVENKPYTREQIKKLIEVAGRLLNNVIIIIMASSGMRQGALPYSRLKDL